MRLAAALEHVAAEAEPSYSPLPPDIPRSGRIDTSLVSQMFRAVQRAGDGRDGIQAYVKALETLAGMEARAD